jgi:putative colanic acid biosynthesis acetyltransferase WcaF
LLSIFGAKIGRGVHIYSSAYIYLPWMLEIDSFSCIGEWAIVYNLGPIKIGSKATISHGAHLCSGTHIYEDQLLPLIRTKVSIGSEAWICTQAYIGPGVSVGEGSVVGARSVVVKNVRPRIVVAGNPAVFLKERNISY